MISKRQLITFLCIALFVALGVAAMRPSQTRYLKVLPQDISDQMLDSIMNTYNKALGVRCGFYHASHKKIEDGLNYSSDENPMKDDAEK